MDQRTDLLQLLDHVLVVSAIEGVNNESSVSHLGISGSIEI